MRLPSGEAWWPPMRPIAQSASGVIKSLFRVMLFFPMKLFDSCALAVLHPTASAAATINALFIIS